VCRRYQQGRASWGFVSGPEPADATAAAVCAATTAGGAAGTRGAGAIPGGRPRACRDSTFPVAVVPNGRVVVAAAVAAADVVPTGTAVVTAADAVADIAPADGDIVAATTLAAAILCRAAGSADVDADAAACVVTPVEVLTL